MIGHEGGCGTHRTKNNSHIPTSESLKRLSFLLYICQRKMSQVLFQHDKESRWAFKIWYCTWKEHCYINIKLN